MTTMGNVATACPDWCEEPRALAEDIGEEHLHTGAQTEITAALGCYVWQARDGEARIYVADGNLTREQGRQLAAGLLAAVALADQLEEERR